MAESDIIVRLRMSAEEFAQGWKRGLQEFEQGVAASNSRLDREAERTGRERGKKIGLAMAAGLTATGVAIKKALDVGLEIDATSKQLGIGAEALQGWRYAAREAGVEASSLESNVAKLTLKIGEANAGNNKAQGAFTALGVSFRAVSGAGRDTEATFLDLLDKLAKIEDPTQRAAQGTALLGDEYYKLEPLVRNGADGLRAATDELRLMQGVLSEDEIRNLHLTNAKLEQMKTILGVRIAGVVADNANAIVGLANALSTATTEAMNFIAAYPRLATALAGAAAGARMGGVHGAIIGAGAGVVGGQYVGQAMDDANMDLAYRQRKLAAARREQQHHMDIQRNGGALFSIRSSDSAASSLPEATAEVRKQTALLQQATLQFKAARQTAGNELALPPSVDPKPGKAKSSGGRGGAGGKPRMSDEDRERERAAKAAQKAEEDFEEAVQRSLEAQSDAARIEAIRAKQGDVAAAAEQARLDFLRQHPLAIHQSVEELAKALGLTKQLTDADKERLQNLIDAADAAERGAVATATAREQKRQDEEAARAAQRQADEMRRAHEDAVRDVADLWEDLFTGGTDRIWKNFKSLGTRIISEIAAQYTLALLSGQSMGSVNLGGIASGAIANSPLGSLFNLGGGLFGRGAANDNGGMAGAYGLNFGVSGSDVMAAMGWGGSASSAAASTGGGGSAKAGSLLDQAGFALAASSLVQMTGIGKGGGQLGQLLSLGGSIGGQSLGSSLAALGAFGGPVGAIAGAVLGSLVGGVLGKAFKKTKRGEATISGGGISVAGNSSSREDAANSAAQSVMDTMEKLADALGGTLDWSNGAVTISQRKNDWRVDTTGKGISKKSNGALDFDGDEQAAIAAAVRDLIEDGVLPGISQASKNILLAGGDLEKAIEKAVLIESVPRLLRERLDPLGAALDAVDDKFRQLAAALNEAGASTEQIAQAKELYKLERQDVIDQFGEVAQSLKDFLLSLQAGSNSPLSLRAQKAEAEDALKVYTDQIGAAQAARARVNQLKASGASAEDIAAAEAAAQAAASKIDQDGFKQTSDLLLSISRNMNASSDQFFDDYDRIRSLTQTAIDLIEQAVPAAGADGNWDALISKTDTTNSLLGAINDNLISLGAKGLTTAQIATANSNTTATSDWMIQQRAYI